MFRPHKVEHVQQLRSIAILPPATLTIRLGSLKSKNWRDGIEWSLVQEEYRPVLKLLFRAIRQHQVGQKTGSATEHTRQKQREPTQNVVNSDRLTPHQFQAAEETGMSTERPGQCRIQREGQKSNAVHHCS